MALVYTLPAEPATQDTVHVDYVDYKEVLETYNPLDIALVKSILDAGEIQYFFQGEHFLHVKPLALPARLMVRVDQVEEAREILKDISLTFTGISARRDPDENP